MNRASRLIRWAGSLCFLVAVTPHSAHAASYYLQANQGSPNTWNNTSLWFDAPSGGSTLASGPNTFVAQDLFANGFNIRTSDTAANLTLGDATTTLTFNAKFTTRASFTEGETAFVNTITTTGTSAHIAAGNGSGSIGATNFNVDGTTILSGDGTAGRTMRLTAVNLAGAGNFEFSVSFAQFNVTNGSGYTGNFTWQGGSTTVLEFLADATFGGSAIVPTGGSINLHQDITLAGLTLNGTPLDSGTYSYATLNATYDAFFTDGGSGSITIPAVPEPASLGMIGLGGLLMLKRRRTA